MQWILFFALLLFPLIFVKILNIYYSKVIKQKVKKELKGELVFIEVATYNRNPFVNEYYAYPSVIDFVYKYTYVVQGEKKKVG